MSTLYSGITNLAEPKVYGMHDGLGNCYYQAECQVCFLRNAGRSAAHSKLNHLIHCSRKHSYVFEEDYPIIPRPEDETLQETIRLAMLYGLPMPGYEIHNNCVRQEQQGQIVCILHDMQGSCAMPGGRHWLGYL